MTGARGSVPGEQARVGPAAPRRVSAGCTAWGTRAGLPCTVPAVSDGSAAGDERREDGERVTVVPGGHRAQRGCPSRSRLVMRGAGRRRSTASRTGPQTLQYQSSPRRW